MRAHALVVGLLVLALPTAGHAEVMDKEPAVSLVWAWALFGGVVGASAWAVRWWLGLPLTAVLAVLLGGIWSEIADPVVGPAIRAEVGAGYIWNAAAATITAACMHVLGALVGHRWRRVRKSKAAV
jgi:hypothetical protein